MLEPWDEILTLEKEWQSCADDVTAIKAACATDHGKRHVSECSECWSRVLNRMRDRYLNSATKEWFSGRRLFLQDLDTLFTQAHEKKTDLKSIEQRIADEKREWFRDRVRNLGLQYATKTPNEAKALQEVLNDRSIPVDQLASELRSIFNDDALLSDATVHRFLDRLRAAESPDARKEICIELFFQPGHNAENDAKYQKYVDMVRSGTWVFEVVNIMIRDRQVAKANQDQKQALQRKLEELRRARAAHEVDKTKKAKIRQDKANAAAAAAAAAESEDSLPPCAVCTKTVDPEDFHTCPICFVSAELYELQKEPLVFCSQDCSQQGYVSASSLARAHAVLTEHRVHTPRTHTAAVQARIAQIYRTKMLTWMEKDSWLYSAKNAWNP